MAVREKECRKPASRVPCGCRNAAVSRLPGDSGIVNTGRLLGRTLLCLAFMAGTPAAGAADLEDLAFLTGHWVHSSGGTRIEEAWFRPEADTMSGVFRWAEDGKVIAIELLIVSAEAGHIYFRFKHYSPDFVPWESAQPNTYLLEESRKGRRAVFRQVSDNPAVPAFIVYTLDDGILTFRGTSAPDENRHVEDLVLRMHPAPGTGE